MRILDYRLLSLKGVVAVLLANLATLESSDGVLLPCMHSVFLPLLEC